MAHTPRLYVRGPLTPGPLQLDGEQAKRLGAVLRMRAGDEFLAFNGDGHEWRAVVEATTRGGVLAKVTGLERQEPAPALVVETWCALVRPQRFEWAVEKCVEAGADIIRPLICDHSARGEGGSAAKQERWQRIAIEASEQCGRLTAPVVEAPARFDEMLGRAVGPVFFGEPGGRTWGDAAALLPAQGRVCLAVGPEGGWSEDEIAKARARGAVGVSLGANILRTETAAVVLTAMVRVFEPQG
ncbi:MAG: RsmE family RNA methyltransferase [Tepidiformaceae bacterium]